MTKKQIFVRYATVGKRNCLPAPSWIQFGNWFFFYPKGAILDEPMTKSRPLSDMPQ
jgi:hypothetical protein